MPETKSAYEYLPSPDNMVRPHFWLHMPASLTLFCKQIFSFVLAAAVFLVCGEKTPPGHGFHGGFAEAKFSAERRCHGASAVFAWLEDKSQFHGSLAFRKHLRNPTSSQTDIMDIMNVAAVISVVKENI